MRPPTTTSKPMLRSHVGAAVEVAADDEGALQQRQHAGHCIEEQPVTLAGPFVVMEVQRDHVIAFALHSGGVGNGNVLSDVGNHVRQIQDAVCGTRRNGDAGAAVP